MGRGASTTGPIVFTIEAWRIWVAVLICGALLLVGRPLAAEESKQRTRIDASFIKADFILAKSISVSDGGWEISIGFDDGFPMIVVNELGPKAPVIYIAADRNGARLDVAQEKGASCSLLASEKGSGIALRDKEGRTRIAIGLAEAVLQGEKSARGADDYTVRKYR